MTKGDILCEMRLYVANSELDDYKKKEVSDNDSEEELTAAKIFNEKII